jgi:hypothetical protein
VSAANHRRCYGTHATKHDPQNWMLPSPEHPPAHLFKENTKTDSVRLTQTHHAVHDAHRRTAQSRATVPPDNPAGPGTLQRPTSPRHGYFQTAFVYPGLQSRRTRPIIMPLLQYPSSPTDRPAPGAANARRCIAPRLMPTLTAARDPVLRWTALRAAVVSPGLLNVPRCASAGTQTTSRSKPCSAMPSAAGPTDRCCSPTGTARLRFRFRFLLRFRRRSPPAHSVATCARGAV